MTARATLSHVASPLDPFLLTFLSEINRLPEGFSPTADAPRLAEACDVPPGFIEVLFTSARTRGFLEAFRVAAPKKGYRWRVSKRGRQWAEDARDGIPLATD